MKKQAWDDISKESPIAMILKENKIISKNWGKKRNKHLLRTSSMPHIILDVF